MLHVYTDEHRFSCGLCGTVASIVCCVVVSLALLNWNSSCLIRSLWDSWPCRLSLFIVTQHQRGACRPTCTHYMIRGRRRKNIMKLVVRNNVRAKIWTIHLSDKTEQQHFQFLFFLLLNCNRNSRIFLQYWVLISLVYLRHLQADYTLDRSLVRYTSD